METAQPLKSVATLGSRYPRQVALVRVAVGIWLLVLTAILYNSGHAGGWEWLLAATGVLHFGLAYRLLRIARRHPARDMRFQ